ncbi:hypothetical protein HPB49_001050 [Dermacentor silvarum]|uniref:Uncharacterized protein n=1 Tax=Dermacentor silvarum TaxID=543639 RepID=A0ACB8D1X9_DERSI|nr:hypothetical protein HPB49_001050 [Dermacentor silvarum]
MAALGQLGVTQLLVVTDPRGRRKANFSRAEIDALVTGYKTYRPLIERRCTGGSKDRNQAWEFITKSLFAVSGVRRTAAEVRKKWADLKSLSKKGANCGATAGNLLAEASLFNNLNEFVIGVPIEECLLGSSTEAPSSTGTEEPSDNLNTNVDVKTGQPRQVSRAHQVKAAIIDALCASTLPPPPGPTAEEAKTMSGDHRTVINGSPSQYVKLNVGGSLHYTTIGTLTKHDSMLRAMFSGRMEVLTDSEGWILIDRCGKHFGTILNFLRDGSVPLPESTREIAELLAEAKYYLIQALVESCEAALQKKESPQEPICRVPLITNEKEGNLLISTSTKPLVKLLINRHNNKYSYTSTSDDNLLKNVEMFDRLSLRFCSRVLFIKDVIGSNEICCWTFYGHGKKVAEVCCTSIVYATDKKHTKNLFATCGQESSEIRKSCEVVCLDVNLDFVLHKTVVRNKRADVSSTA